jgi:hypothetical protein
VFGLKVLVLVLVCFKLTLTPPSKHAIELFVLHLGAKLVHNSLYLYHIIYHDVVSIFLPDSKLFELSGLETF